MKNEEINKLMENSNNSICNKCGKKYVIGHSSPIGFLCKKCLDNFPCPECNRPRNVEEKARQEEKTNFLLDLESYLEYGLTLEKVIKILKKELKTNEK